MKQRENRIAKKIKRVKQVAGRTILFSICVSLINIWIRLFLITDKNPAVLLIGVILGILIIPLALINFKYLVYVNDNESQFIVINVMRLCIAYIVLGILLEDAIKNRLFTEDGFITLAVLVVSLIVSTFLFKMEFSKLIKKELK